MNDRPILYSFRRCPYAMRARMGLVIAKQSVELREILLRDKPQEMLAASSKGTVPVLILADGQVLDESLDILYWALERAINIPLAKQLIAPSTLEQAKELIELNDTKFKPSLDRYKYATRYPEKSELDYRRDGEVFLANLEKRLSTHRYLCAEQMSVADIAIFPFIRQFAGVDRSWFEQSNYHHVIKWLKGLVESEHFIQVMQKFPLWKDDPCKSIIFPVD